MKIAIVGTRGLSLSSVVDHVLGILWKLGASDCVLLRRGRSTPASRFESEVDFMCRVWLKIPVKWCEPSKDVVGRGSVYLRDVAMVRDSDVVLAFLVGSDADEGNSGTWHVVQKAIEVDRPVYAFRVVGDTVERVGEIDIEQKNSVH